MDLREHLRGEYTRIAIRYSQVTGKQPPPLVADTADLQATIARMLDVLRGHRDADAGPAIDVEIAQAVVGAAGASVMVPLLDAAGKHAGMLTFALGPNEPCVRALLAELRVLAKKRLEQS